MLRPCGLSVRIALRPPFSRRDWWNGIHTRFRFWRFGLGVQIPHRAPFHTAIVITVKRRTPNPLFRVQILVAVPISNAELHNGSASVSETDGIGSIPFSATIGHVVNTGLGGRLQICKWGSDSLRALHRKVAQLVRAFG